MTIPTKHFNPWLTMWFRPRETIQSIIDRNPGKSVLLLVSLSGISKSIGNASIKHLGDKNQSLDFFFQTIISGIISGVIGLYIFGFLLKHAGRWLGGNSNSKNIRAAIAWSCIPVAWSLLLLIPELAIFGKELFKSTAPTIEAHPFLTLGFVITEITISIWSLILLFISIGQVHGFSAWRGLGACLIAMTLIFLPLIGLAKLLSF
jgi:hypothetical protein